MFKISLFGFSKKDVEMRLKDYENLIDLQKKDIEFLKRDNNILKNTLARLTKDHIEADKI